MEFFHWLADNKVAVVTGTLLVLKWIYNAAQPGTTFAQFARAFLGELVQEAPNSLGGLTVPEKQAVLRMRAEAPSAVKGEDVAAGVAAQEGKDGK